MMDCFAADGAELLCPPHLAGEAQEKDWRRVLAEARTGLAG